MEYSYAALLEADPDGGYVVSFRDIPEAITQGENLEDALTEAADALEEAVAAYLDNGRELPQASPARGNEHWVPVPIATACKAMLARAMDNAGLSKSELARRLDTDPREIRRMLDPRHPTKLDRMEAALVILGVRPSLHVAAA